MRWRKDLVVEEHRYQGREFWVVKDPLRLKYFRFEQEEHWLLTQLDGSRSLDAIREEFENRFAPQQITLREIYRLIGMAHRGGLVVSDGAGQGAELLERHREHKRKRLRNILGELLSLRFRGVDPDRWLQKLDGYVGWVFSWPAVIAAMMIGAAALLLIVANVDDFVRKLPASHEFFGPSNWLLLATTLAIVKILHELGHGLACKRFGGECHEMGLMLLCFTPCLYCDVTDSWMIPSRWKRAAIGAAGMYVELWLASLATFMWWTSEPGIVHHLALNVMFVGSVSTLVFNANPLMRYDGYYILSDLLEIPNLRSKASTLVSSFARRFFFGGRVERDPFLPAKHRFLLASYAIASAVYRWVVAASILWFLYKLTEPYGFKIIGQLLAICSLVGLVGVPLYSAVMFFKTSWMMEDGKMTRAIGRASIVAAVIIALCFVPLPYYVRCAMRLQPREAGGVYVDVPGQLAEIFVHPGDHVTKDQPIARLANLDLERALARLQTQRDAQSGKVASLRQRALGDDVALGELAGAEESLVAISEEIDRRHEQREKLVLRAPRDGVVLAAARKQPADDSNGRLPTWHGHPLEARNVGALLDASVLVCQIGDPSQWEAIIAVDQNDVGSLASGQRVDLLPAQRPGARIATTLVAVSQRDMKFAPAEMSGRAGGLLLSKTDSSGRERPLFVTYEASAAFDDDSQLLAASGGGIARVHAGYRTIAARLWQEARRTFHFEM